MTEKYIDIFSSLCLNKSRCLENTSTKTAVAAAFPVVVSISEPLKKAPGVDGYNTRKGKKSDASFWRFLAPGVFSYYVKRLRVFCTLKPFLFSNLEKTKRGAR